MEQITLPMSLKEESGKMNNTALVNRIIPFSNVDGPGNRLAVFFQGCNIKCLYCHNPETINRCTMCMECIKKCPTGAIEECNGKIVYDEKKCAECDTCIKTCKFNSSPRTKEYTVDELYKVIEDYRLFIRGITVSGGEPTLQAEFITELFKKVKPLGLSCFVDTNGIFNKDKITDLIDAADKFMIDIKALDKIQDVCGANMSSNLDNLIYLLKLNKVYEVRTVVVLDYIDVENTVFKTAETLKDYPEVSYKLIRVHAHGVMENQKEKIKDKIPSEEYMHRLSEKIKAIGVKKVELIL
jgi:pyruvate formate lyase activating enzyme